MPDFDRRGSKKVLSEFDQGRFLILAASILDRLIAVFSIRKAGSGTDAAATTARKIRF